MAVCCCSASVSSCALLHVVEKPHILDRDYRLIGEGGNQLNLFFGERLDDRSHQANGADRDALAQQRHSKHRTILATALIFKIVVLRVCQTIWQMNGLLLKSSAADERTTSRCDGVCGGVLDKNCGRIVRCGQVVFAILQSKDKGKLCIA